MTNLLKADAILWAREEAWTCQAAAALIQGISPKGLEVAHKRVLKSTARAQYETRQEGLEDEIARVVSAMKIFEASPPNGRAPYEWVTHAKSLKLEVIDVWDELLSEVQPADNREIHADDDLLVRDVQKKEPGEPYLKQQSTNSRAGVDKWVKWQAQQIVKESDTTHGLAGKIKAIADRWGYKSERGQISVASIVKMLPVGVTGGRAKNKSTKKKVQK